MVSPLWKIFQYGLLIISIYFSHVSAAGARLVGQLYSAPYCQLSQLHRDWRAHFQDGSLTGLIVGVRTQLGIVSGRTQLSSSESFQGDSWAFPEQGGGVPRVF